MIRKRMYVISERNSIEPCTGMDKLLFFKDQLQLQLLKCNSITSQKCNFQLLNFQLLQNKSNVITFQKSKL